jgi:hypothetical protein
MAPGDDLVKVVDVDAGVEGGRLKALMAEKLLDVADAGLPFEQVSGIGVAERVREDSALDSSGLGVLGEERPKTGRTHAETVLREEESELARVLHELEPCFTKVEVEGGDGPTGEWHDAILLSFAAPYEKKLLAEIDVSDVEPQTLAAAKACPVEDFEDGAVALSLNARARGRAHEPPRLRFR